MDPWRQLTDELDRWHGDGRVATLWWRDDDAVEPTAALARLLDVHARHAVPLALAAIPARARAALAGALEPHPGIAVLQHGYAHDDHSGKGERAIELGGQRRRKSVVADLEKGRDTLWKLFPERVLPVLVPPWNRIAAEFLVDLPRLGFGGLSRFAPRQHREPTSGLLETNCHADLIDWRGGRRFRGTERTLGQLCDHLAARREGRADESEPTGVLSHHLVHDDDCWRFLDGLLELCGGHPGARWLETDAACLAR